MLKYEITGDSIISALIWVMVIVLTVGLFLYANITKIRTDVKVMEEKISALEDIVFNNGVYKIISKEVENVR